MYETKVSRKRLLQEVERCRRVLSMYPGDERYTESLGRALRLLGDPEGPTYLRMVAEMVSERLPSGRKFHGSVYVGNLYRLAGDQRLSQNFLAAAY
jgi:hypothetical protein